MIRDRHDKQLHQDDKSAGASHHETGRELARRLAAECIGAPAKLHDLLQTLSPGLRTQVIAEAHVMYGNGFVQRAMKNIGPGYASAQPGGVGSGTLTPGETPSKANPTGTTPAQQAAQNNQGSDLAHPADFDRSQMLAGLINSRPTGGGTAPGQRDPASLVSDAGKLPTAGDLMNHTTKQGAQSDEPAPSESPTPLGPLTEADQKETDRLKDVVAVNHTGEDHVTAAPDQTPHAGTGPSSLTLDNLSIGRIWALLMRPITNYDEKFKPQPVFTGRGTRGTPDPTNDGGISKEDLPSLATVIADHQHQNSMPNETSNKGPRVHADLKEAFMVSQGQHQGGRIDPGPGDGTTTNLGSGAPAPAPGSGIEQVDGTTPNKPGKHPDEG